MFSKYPTIKRNNKDVRDLTIRFDIIERVKNNTTLFQYVEINTGQRPEDIAYAFYNDPELFWIILILNDIVDPYHEWHMTDEDLYTYCVEKYGIESIYNIHHYETTEDSEYGAGVWVDANTIYSNPVTNYTYEFNKNEERRKIKILPASYVPQILRELDRTLANVGN